MTAQPRVLIAGHDLKFLGPLRAHLAASGVPVTEDVWTGHDRHDEEASRSALAEADVVLCEWCVGNAVWYSRHVRPGQRLVVRLHRMENETDYPAQLELDRVDALVFVAEHIRAEALVRFGYQGDKTRVVPNAVPVDALRKPKIEGATFTLGLLGWVPERKRLDRALDVLERLRAKDDRFHLVCKGHAPWDLDWVLGRTSERTYFSQVLARITATPLLRDSVSFEPFGADVGGFLRRIGFLLSTSDAEGHQVAVLEAMAAGCLPVVLDRPGARDQYAADQVFTTAHAAAWGVLDRIDAGPAALAAARAQVSRSIAERYDLPVVLPLWDEVLGLDALIAVPT